VLIHFKHSVELVDDNAEIVDRPGGRRGLHAGEGYLRRGGEALAEGAHPIMPGGQDSRGQRSGMTRKSKTPGMTWDACAGGLVTLGVGSDGSDRLKV